MGRVEKYLRVIVRKMRNRRFDNRIAIIPDDIMRVSCRYSLNRLCDISDWGVAQDLSNIMQQLCESVCIHRKAWEFAMCIYGLSKLGAIKPGSKAISIGAGHERALFWFANRIDEIVATDLYDDKDEDSEASMLTYPEKYAPFEFRKKHLKVHRMSGTNLEFEDDSFDFAYSLSSVEHFGFREDQEKTMREIYRVTKPGGLACISTELVLNRETHTEYFTIDELNCRIINSTPFQLIGGDIDWRISESLVEHPVDLELEKDDLRASPHIVLRNGNVVFTSIILFFQKTA